MTLAFAASAFVLAYVAVWLLLRRSLFDAVLGFGLLAHVGNLIMLASGGFGEVAPVGRTVGGGAPAPGGGTVASGAPGGSGSLPAPTADPLPQALILTAIVISMAVLIYFVGLFRRGAQSGEDRWS